jgi:hypothetical protein
MQCLAIGMNKILEKTEFAFQTADSSGGALSQIAAACNAIALSLRSLDK